MAPGWATPVLPGLRDADAAHVAGAAALVAAALVVLAGLAVLLLVASDELASTLGDRVRLATDVVRLPAPLLLATGLVLRERGATDRVPAVGRAAGRAGAGDRRAWDALALVVAAVTGVLLAAGLLVDLLGTVAGEGAGGSAGRASAVLQDLAALVLVAALASWARRGAAARTPPPAPGTGSRS